MSSDSDIDYESADEDANIISEVTANVKDILLENQREVDSTKSTEETEKILVPKISSSTENTAQDSLDENDRGSAGDVEKNAPESSSKPTNILPDVPPKNSSPSDNDIAKKNELAEIKNSMYGHSETNFQTSDISATYKKVEVDTSRTKAEKHRVPLRLEKKIQQKSLSSEDSSNEKLLLEESQKQPEVKPSSWGFSSWGSSLLSTAASSVSMFTNQVSQGIGTVLETVESTLGVPPPEELAEALSQSSEASDPSTEKSSDTTAKDNPSEPRSSSILPDVSAWSKVLEDTGSKVIMGGLDTLELIGKKTIDIITEGDPGLRKKRSLFGDGITLSQILREAKAEADDSKQDANSDGINAIHYTQFFDEYQGLVHLEALEMLSKQSEAKVHRNLMRIPKTTEVRKQLEEIKSICENLPCFDDSTDSSETFEEFDTVSKKHILELNLPFNVENLIKTQKRITDVVKSYESVTANSTSPEEIYQSAICSLAEFTAKSIETFHKLSELILVQAKLETNAEHFATNLTGLTAVMCIEVNSLSSRYQHCFDSLVEQSEGSDTSKPNVTAIVTNLYVEASNSIKYIQDAFLLLVPVLQVSLLELSS